MENQASGEVLRTLSGHSDGVSSVTISPDGTRVVSEDDDKIFKVWDLASGKCLETFCGDQFFSSLCHCSGWEHDGGGEADGDSAFLSVDKPTLGF